jgi:ribonuclease BN (tRNA processing enzyme)
MQITVLGSGTVAPSATRMAPAYWVDAGSCRLLLECGAGTLHRAAAFGVPWWDATHVAVTHFHPDHWGELPMYLFALRWGVEPPRTAGLTLLGPRGLRARLGQLAGAYGDWVTRPDYPLDVMELEPDTVHELANGVVLETCSTPHTDESLAFAVRTSVARLVYTGDTGPSETLAEFARGCDLLIAECSLPDARAIDSHLSPTSAGALVRAAGPGRVVLTHFYPVFGDEDPAAIVAAASGAEVVAAQDGDRFTVGEEAE